MPFRFNPFTDKLDLTETGGGPGSGIQTITGNTGGAVGPDGAGNVNVIGSGALSFAGNPGTHTETGQISGTYSLLLASQGPGVDAVFQDFLDNSFTFTNLTAANSRLLTVTSTNTTDLLINAGVVIHTEADIPGFAFGGYPYILMEAGSTYSWLNNIDFLNGGPIRWDPNGNFSTGAFYMGLKQNGTFLIQAGGFVVHGNQPADPTYNMTEVDMAIFRSSFNAQTFVLPSPQNQAQMFIISDQLGSANSGPITIDGNGQLINGQSTYTINQNFGAAIVMWSGSRWCVIGGSNQSMPFTEVTSGTQAMVVYHGYQANGGSLITLTLPTSAQLGDEIQIMGKGAGGWTITYTTGQQIIFGNQSTTVTSGSLSSSNQYDCCTLRCMTASTTAPIFQVVDAVGNLTVA